MSKKEPNIKPESLVGITLTQAQKDQWLSALRSGRYKQGKAALVKDGCFCCLGVLGETLGLAPIKMENLAWLDSVMGEECPLGPNDIGIKLSVQDILSTMNDDGETFATIADFIEMNVPACDAAPI